MSHSILEDLYYVRCGNFETIPISDEYKKILDEIIKKEKILSKTFDKKQETLFYDYCDLHGRLESEHGLACYIEGFKIGLRVGIECMEE